jgi:hypothetical protein
MFTIVLQTPCTFCERITQNNSISAFLFASLQQYKSTFVNRSQSKKLPESSALIALRRSAHALQHANKVRHHGIGVASKKQKLRALINSCR